MSHRVLLTFLAGAFVVARLASAQATYEVIHRFNPGYSNPVGRLAEAPDGSLFGTAYTGGPFRAGGVFALRPSTGGQWSAEIVHAFQPEFDGGLPWGGLISGRDGNFYGLTTTNSVNDPFGSAGTVFRLTPSGDFTVLHTFSGSEGHMPVWRLLEASDGNFYGSTCGASDSTIFRVTPAGEYTALHRLYLPQASNPYALGVCPVTELWEGSDGFLYGQATYAGPFTPVTNGGGTLFRIDPRDSPPQRFTLLHAFSGPDGAQPVGGLVPGPGGALYGSAYQAGPLGNGLIFRTEPTGGVTTVHSFEGADGANPYGGLFPAADGSLYGTASWGGTGFGTLFKIDAGGQFSRLHAFDGADGRAPVELMQARDGLFYGVTYYDGPGGGGTAFRLNPDNSVETLHAFSGEGESAPKTGVIEAADGNFYLTTESGAVFKLSPARQLTLLHHFGSAASPSGLIQAADGYFYGTTERGGAHDRGTVFRIGATGGHTVLHSFVESFGSPSHGVVQASDGNLYGATTLLAPPTLFRMDTSGNLTSLHTLTQPEGFNPTGPLVEGSAGNLYGMMREGGIGYGTLFKLTTSGEFTVVHTFGFGEGLFPSGGLARGRDGHIYGVTTAGGAFSRGTLFRLEAAGDITMLHSFEESDGFPRAVIEGRDGALYGLTLSDPVFAFAKFFRFTTGLTIVYTSVPADGRAPSPRLIQGSDGAFYGTVMFGEPSGESFNGGVFRLHLPPVP